MSLWAGALAAHLTLTSLRPRTCTCHGAPCQVGLLAAVFNPNPNPSPNPEQVGFLAAVFNNGIDCVQNVFSKKLLSSHYNYVNLQAAPPHSRHPSHCSGDGYRSVARTMEFASTIAITRVLNSGIF